MKLYLVNRKDHRGILPVKVFAQEELAKNFSEECNEFVKTMNSQDDPEEHIGILKLIDINAEFCYNGISYFVEPIISE